MNQPFSYLETWIDEYHQGVRYGLEGKILAKETSDFQEITLFCLQKGCTKFKFPGFDIKFHKSSLEDKILFFTVIG